MIGWLLIPGVVALILAWVFLLRAFEYMHEPKGEWSWRIAAGLLLLGLVLLVTGNLFAPSMIGVHW